MLSIHNQILKEIDLKSMKIDVELSGRRNLLKTFNSNPRSFEIHPYVFSFFLENDIVKEGIQSNNYIFYWANKNAELNVLSQEALENYLDHKKNNDIQNLIKLEAFFKLNRTEHLKTVKQQLRDCGIEVKQVSTWRDRIITVLDQDFVFKEWGCDGKHQFRDWMRRNQLRIINNIVNSSNI
jgi:hypothetical protein